jgi:hypothetical protein
MTCASYVVFLSESSNLILRPLSLAIYQSSFPHPIRLYIIVEVDTLSLNNIRSSRFEVFTAVKIEFMVFWVAAQCSVVV